MIVEARDKVKYFLLITVIFVRYVCLHIRCYVSFAYRILCAPYAMGTMCPLHIGVICTCKLGECTFYPQYKVMIFHKLYSFLFCLLWVHDEIFFVFSIEIIITNKYSTLDFLHIETELHIGTEIQAEIRIETNQTELQIEI